MSHVIRAVNWRQSPTTPPPATLAGDLRAKASRTRALAAELLAQANDLDAAASRMERDK